jgi:hypothetical protein
MSVRVGLCPECLKLRELRGEYDQCASCNARVLHGRTVEHCEMCDAPPTVVADLTLDEFKQGHKVYDGTRVVVCGYHAERIDAERGWQDEQRKRRAQARADLKARQKDSVLFDPEEGARPAA